MSSRTCRIYLHIILLFFLWSPYAKAQDTLSKQSDSFQNRILIEQSDQLEKLEEQKTVDSSRYKELEDELHSLRDADKVRRRELLTQIEELKNANAKKLQEQESKIDSLRKFVQGFAVAPFRDTLFYIYNRIGSFTPKDRAAAITERIRNLQETHLFDADSLKTIPAETSVDIVYGENVIISIFQKDALWENTTPAILADSYRKKIADAILLYEQQTSWKNILTEIALALLVILFLVILIFAIGRLFRFIRSKLVVNAGKKLKGLKIQNYELLNIRTQLRLLLFLVAVIRWVVVILAIYLSLPLLFSIFPQTGKFADMLIGFFLNPVKSVLTSAWNYLPNFFTIIVIVIIFHYVGKFIRFLKIEVEKGKLKIEGFYPDWAQPTYQIIRVLLSAFMLVIIFPYLPGSNSPIFQGVSVFLGVLFTFGSTGPLSNAIAGIVLTYMRTFKTGDRIKIGDVTGDVVERTLLVTRVRTIKNEIISIPNSTAMSSHTINYSSDAPEKGLILYTSVTIGYDAPWRKVHQLLTDAALATTDIEKEPAPFVLQTSLDDFFVSYQINAYTKEPNKQANIYSLLHQNIQDKFNEGGVEIMSPHYASVRDGNTVTTPSEHLPKDYKAPSFHVTIKETSKKQGRLFDE